MSSREHLRLQQVPYFSTTASTRMQFLDMMNSFLERNGIALIGPSTIEIQQTRDAGIPDSKPFLSLTCEIRSECQSGGFQGARNMVPGIIDSTDPCMSAMQANSAPLDQGGNLFLNETQTFIGPASLDDSYPQTTPPMTWDFEIQDFANPLTTVSLGNLSPALVSDTMPSLNMSTSVTNSLPAPGLRSLSSATTSAIMQAGSEASLDNDADSVTSITLSGSCYSKSGDYAQLNSKLGTSINGTNPVPLAAWMLSPTNSGATCHNPPMAIAGNFPGTSMYEQGGFQVPDAQRAGDNTFGHDGPITLDSPQLPVSVQDSPASSSHRALQRQDKLPHLRSRSHHTPQPGEKSSGTTTSVVKAASQNILREDYLQFLETGLPRWSRDTLWSDARSLEPTIGTSTYRELELAYSSVCQLDIRMDDDAIRNRMALIRLHLEYTKAYERQNQNIHVRSIGRGGASVIIDAILESIHKEWKFLDGKKKSDLRVRFHERKRYGKRWLLLTDVLGPSITILCSTKVSNMVHNTAVTVKVLKSIALKVKTDHADIMRILHTMNPVASWLFDNDGGTRYEFDDIIKQLRNMGPVAPGNEENNQSGV